MEINNDFAPSLQEFLDNNDEDILQQDSNNNKPTWDRENQIDGNNDNLAKSKTTLELTQIRNLWMHGIDWSDLTIKGKNKIISIIMSPYCKEIDSRTLAFALPCSKSTIARVRKLYEKNREIDNLHQTKKGRPTILSKNQIEIFLEEATNQRKQMLSVSLEWAKDFIIKRFDLKKL